MLKKKILVVGGGAAGFFCAVNVARMNPDVEVSIIEKSTKLLSKVRISGGGRCNVTHACFSITDMLKRYPRGANFLKKSFRHFFTTDTIEWFKVRNVALHEEADGRMFPVSNSSQTIIECLVQEANKYGVQILMNSEVKKIQKNEDGFDLHLGDDRILQADFVCIACGGYPKSSMFEWLHSTGHHFEDPVPSLFTFNMPGNAITKLMGVTVPNVQVKVIGSKLIEQGPLLITHWGMSGPAILKLSAWGAKEFSAAGYKFSIVVNWIPAFNENSLREFIQQYRFNAAAQKMLNRNPFQLPQRLWEFLLEQSGIMLEIRWADLPAKEQNKLIKNLCSQEFAVSGKTTFKEEFVTAGGIVLNEVDPNTMMSRINPKLFFAGEILDVDGVTGGFNFQHAWTSGFIAAKNIAALSLYEKSPVVS